jgi:hypothetical protein
MKKEKLPVKAIFNKTIETSSNFLTDIWKPRDQVDDQDDLKKSCPETDPPNKTHGKSGLSNITLKELISISLLSTSLIIIMPLLEADIESMLLRRF